jgi:hypothetical protein
MHLDMLRLQGRDKPKWSEVSSALVKTNPKIFSAGGSQGAATFRAIAMQKKVITCGEDAGTIWTSLHRDWHGCLSFHLCFFPIARFLEAQRLAGQPVKEQDVPTLVAKSNRTTNDGVSKWTTFLAAAVQSGIIVKAPGKRLVLHPQWQGKITIADC